jgi:hypothetical protein
MLTLNAEAVERGVGSGLRVALVAAGALLSLRGTANGQRARTAGQGIAGVIEFTVVDTARHPVSGAVIAVLLAGRSASEATTSNAQGHARVATGASVGRSYEFSIRSIGFAPASGRGTFQSGDTVRLTIVLHRAPIQLDTVTTSARVRGPRYRITGAEMARLVPDANNVYDALRKTQPEMLGDILRLCGYVRNLWVNGRWMVLAPWDSLVPLYTTTSTRMDGSGRPALHVLGIASHAAESLPLGSLRPEHVVEIRYANCRERSTLGPRGSNALFVTLRPGVGYEVRRGTFIADSAVARAAGVIP